MSLGEGKAHLDGGWVKPSHLTRPGTYRYTNSVMPNHRAAKSFVGRKTGDGGWETERGQKMGKPTYIRPLDWTPSDTQDRSPEATLNRLLVELGRKEILTREELEAIAPDSDFSQYLG